VRTRTAAFTPLGDIQAVEPWRLAEDRAMSGSSLMQAALKLAFLIMLVLVASNAPRQADPAPVRIRR
jgi:hypothetical protein